MEDFRVVARAETPDVLDDAFDRVIAERLDDPVLLVRLLVARLDDIPSPCADVVAACEAATALRTTLVCLQARGALDACPPDS